MSADITSATNQNVTVSAVFSSDSVVKQYSLDSRTWQSYTSGVVMENNGTVVLTNSITLPDNFETYGEARKNGFLKMKDLKELDIDYFKNISDNRFDDELNKYSYKHLNLANI